MTIAQQSDKSLSMKESEGFEKRTEWDQELLRKMTNDIQKRNTMKMNCSEACRRLELVRTKSDMAI